MSENQTETEAIAVLERLDLTAPVSDKELESYKIIVDIIEERKKMAFEQKLESPDSLPGHKIKKGSTTRSLKNTSMVIQILFSLVDKANNRLVPPNVLLKAAKFGIPALETIIKDAYGLTGTEAKMKLAQILGEQLVLKQNKDSLVIA